MLHCPRCLPPFHHHPYHLPFSDWPTRQTWLTRGKWPTRRGFGLNQLESPQTLPGRHHHQNMTTGSATRLSSKLRDGMKINISKTKATVIRRKPKKIHIRIKSESIEQVDSFKYLGCNISSSMNCCQEVKQRIAMVKKPLTEKEAFSAGTWKKNYGRD